MRIGMLSQWYDPETGPAALPGVYAREFTRLGHDVSVLTGFPNYPEGRLYPGYRMRARTRESLGNVQLTRVPLYPNHSRSAVGRAVNYSSFSLTSSLFAGDALRDIDAMWVYNSPVTVALPMLIHSRLGRIPVFLHVQDLWPDSLVDSGMFRDGRVGDVITRLISYIVRLMERRAAVIGVISKGVRDLILERNPRVDPSRIVYVPNPTNEDLFRPSRLIRVEEGIELDKDKMNVMYAGAIGDVQGFDTLIEAASMLSSRADIKFTIVGDGIKKRELEAKARKLGLDNIEFLGRVPQSQVPTLMAKAHIHLVSLAANDFLRFTTPSKIPSLLASEVPIIAQIEGDGARMIEASGAGKVVAPGDAAALADTVQQISDLSELERNMLAASGREYYEQNLSAKSAGLKIIEAMEVTQN
ncbi:glycosyltransferase WbuB [Flaviflexus ciconiae]|uniref:Glycosyltransferase WbuB n=1 Tax=Flaviflexus ciconiae TaxID=2496867 RepID=A0A3Q9G3U5_9ACTO|nr:glycosyltransferase family 4 protein [Flaviflexus ciconiae]AZQ76777.1 glycosyltransferase WbuB [Flaviflexus ciconiae]